MLKKIINVLKQVKLKHCSLKLETCQLCGCKIQVKINHDEMGVRCTRCFATPVAQIMAFAFKNHLTPEKTQVYELSSRGAFVRFLKKQNIDLTLSEYFDDVECGAYKDGVKCQNVESLTFSDNSFDICTSLEVFEHVENDLQGFKEIYRVLKKGGIFIFTVPINLNSTTVERTKIINGKRQNILSPEYHSDTIRGANKVFCYRNYGKDINQRLLNAGFYSCKIYQPPDSVLFGFGRPVIMAKKY